MTRYYDTRVKKIKVLNIPADLLAKKTFLLPVELNKVRIQDTETTKKVEGIKVLKNKVIWTTIDRYHIDTLEEAIEKKVKSLKSYIALKFPKDYKQRSASLGVYSEEENALIISEVKKWYNYIEAQEKIILSCNSIEELELIDFRTEEDKLKDEEMMAEMII